MLVFRVACWLRDEDWVNFLCCPPVCAGMGQVKTLNGRCSSAIHTSAMLGIPRESLPGKLLYLPLYSRVCGDRISVLQLFGICLTLPSDFPSKWLPDCIPALWGAGSQQIQFDHCFALYLFSFSELLSTLTIPSTSAKGCSSLYSCFLS